MADPSGSAGAKPIKFRPLPEDFEASSKQRSEPAPGEHQAEIESTFTSGSRTISANFTLEYSYPAVIFHDVRFSIDKSKQQANFLDECIFRAKRGLAAAMGLETESRTVDILKSVNLSVPYGSIFGLLGPSSCGKTTLLRCLVGLLKPTSGSIRLFGQQSDSDASPAGNAFTWVRSLLSAANHEGRTNKTKVPGSNVGYMPQDLGLYEDFTIREILQMFGRYMRMGNKLTEQRIEFMSQFLELPDIDRRICSLSGGQKRRVSFAIACLHMPPLIILDEPTVGVDPLLRQSIWRYLRRLADEENKTIIITTHYIEEAAQADQVAFMRAGRVLVQDTPSRIMQLNGCRTLEESFLKICNTYGSNGPHSASKPPKPSSNEQQLSLADRLGLGPIMLQDIRSNLRSRSESLPIDQLRLDAKEKMELFDNLRSCRGSSLSSQQTITKYNCPNGDHQLASSTNNLISRRNRAPFEPMHEGCLMRQSNCHLVDYGGKRKKSKLFKRSKFTLNDPRLSNYYYYHRGSSQTNDNRSADNLFKTNTGNLIRRLAKSLSIISALVYKNYRRNFNSIPLVAFQFLLPIVQMISFSLCVGGRPTNIGLGLVNLDQPISFAADLIVSNGSSNDSANYDYGGPEELLSSKYLSLIDGSMLTLKPYDNLRDAMSDVRQAKLWAAMEIGANFSSSLSRRFDAENFYQTDLATINQSVIRLYPDKSNKILHMICHRSLLDSYRRFLSDQFDQFKHLPIEMKEPIFDIEPNIISNSIDGYTESIAPGLLASLTYIMAAGLTTFIMVVERGAGLLERTYTTGINPVVYLLAHAIFRSLLMMLQIALVLALTFYVLKQPLVGSICLAYLMLMSLNLTGIAYGLLISSIVGDQNGAALTIVSSLVIKITLSGILWPLEAIPVWLRTICYVQPLTMPVQALKAIILKGSTVGDRSVNLGFLVSVGWLIVFIVISAKRFKFYQH